MRYRRAVACRSRHGKCPVCGKRVNRQRTFIHAFNPNQAKTYEDLQAEVATIADAWSPDFTHETCKRYGT